VADEQSIGPATADEVAYFARRRTSNEHDARLYVDLAHVAPSGVFVARDEGTAIGIAMPHALEDEWFLSDLYVEPSFRGRGLGLSLLTAAAEGAGAVTRAGVLDPSLLEGLAFYSRVAVPMQMPLLEVAGEVPRASELEKMAAGEHRFGAVPIDPMAHATALNQLDREVRRSARPADHLYFADNAKGFVFTREAEIAGYAYVWPSGRIGPMASVSHNYSVQMLAYALAALRATYYAEWCTLLVPGVNTKVLRAAMKARLRIAGTKIFASDNIISDLTRYIGGGSLMF